MSKVVLALTGSVAVGKTTIARAMAERFSARVLPTRELLIAYAERHHTPVTLDRQSLQRYGMEIDEHTGSRWFVDEVERVARQSPTSVLIVDAVRLPRQLGVLRDVLGDACVQVHVDLSLEERERRYLARADRIDDASYAKAVELDPDAAMTQLGKLAQIRLDGGLATSVELAMFCGGTLGLDLSVKPTGHRSIPVDRGAH